MTNNDNTSDAPLPTIFVLSGSLGASGEQLVRKVLAQFQGDGALVKICPRIHQPEQIETIVAKASQGSSIIVNTIVNEELTQVLIKLAEEQQVVVIDVVRSLLDQLSILLGQKPMGKPGLYRQLHASYFKRIEAIEFTLDHDDGKNAQDWSEAEIVIAGVSRVGKTPISLYLSMLGWKVANVPLVKNVQPRSEFFQLDRRRVVGLTIDPNQLRYHRRHRERRLKGVSLSHYVDLVSLYEEIDEVTQLLKREHIKLIDVTNKPIETSADEVVELVNRQLNSEAAW
ncbi:MAG: kinase/pyrophosphorylase [Anaerolineaceae bacterium]|nr:kinase/pyrophosphorylase [Anaerolineaceae bacterium]MCB9102349.1 kinase/pyrophosphorylase [Anaerolineales bacterium]